MTEIKLHYAEVIALAGKMKAAAAGFEANQKALEQNVGNLKSSWSGVASDVMQKELKEMNKHAAEMQDSLQGMAAFVAAAAEALKAADKASIPVR